MCFQKNLRGTYMSQLLIFGHLCKYLTPLKEEYAKRIIKLEDFREVNVSAPILNSFENTLV